MSLVAYDHRLGRRVFLFTITFQEIVSHRLVDTSNRIFNGLQLQPFLSPATTLKIKFSILFLQYAHHTDIHMQVVGQPEAVKAVANAIRLSRSGLANADRPIASFLMAGPSGTGKTLLSKTV